MRILKLKNKLNCIIIILFGLILTFNCTQAVILADSGNNINRTTFNILNWGLGIIFLLSFPLFIIGVYKLYKDKKKKKEKFKIISLAVSTISVAVLFYVFLCLYGFVVMFIFAVLAEILGESISLLLFILPILFFAVYLFGLCWFCKKLLKLYELNYFIILSIIFFIFSILIYTMVFVVA